MANIDIKAIGKDVIENMMAAAHDTMNEMDEDFKNDVTFPGAVMYSTGIVDYAVNLIAAYEDMKELKNEKLAADMMGMLLVDFAAACYDLADFLNGISGKTYDELKNVDMAESINALHRVVTDYPKDKLEAIASIYGIEYDTLMDNYDKVITIKDGKVCFEDAEQEATEA